MESMVFGVSGSSSAQRLLVALLMILVGNIAALAQPAALAKPAEVPGDIFGFTDATSVDEPGKKGAGLSFDGQFGKRDGSFSQIDAKYSFALVVAPRTSIEVAAFTVWHSISNVTTIPINRDALQFNGLAAEIAYLLVPRSLSNPFAIRVAIEPRWTRIDGAGSRAQAWQGELKLAVDAPIIDGKLFWAANAVFGVQHAQIAPTAVWQTASSLKFSTALALALTEDVFIGAEATYVRSYNKLLGSFTGHSLFLGPTLMAKFGNVTLSATIAPQIAGKAKNVPGRLDLDNGARYVSRLKFGYEF